MSGSPLSPEQPRARRLTEPPATTPPGDLLRGLVPLIRDWLPTRRWFAGKGRPLRSCEPLSATVLQPGDPALLHLIVQVSYEDGASTDGRTECYQLFLGTRGDLPGRLEECALGRISGGTHDGLVVHDALFDGDLTKHLLGRLASAEPAEGPEVRAASVRPAFHRVADARVPSGISGRIGTAEQTNTSVVFGDSAILKLFRRLEPGVNPDLELSLALDQAGCTSIPTTLAWCTAEIPDKPGLGDGLPVTGAGQPGTLGLLQEFLPDTTDGFTLALAAVRHGCQPDSSKEPAEPFVRESYLLGRATADVHQALANSLPVVELDHHQVELLAQGMARRLDAAAEAIPQLRPYQTALHTTFDALRERGTRGVPAHRVHGDLHLGQALRTANGWLLIDFEGEPTRPLTERRLPQPAMRDIAGMLRSFDYAAGHLLAEHPPDTADSALAARAEQWAADNRAAYCAGYAAGGGADPTADPVLLRAFETDKAIYEVNYEARHRPAWLTIPLTAVARLAERPDGG